MRLTLALLLTIPIVLATGCDDGRPAGGVDGIAAADAGGPALADALPDDSETIYRFTVEDIHGRPVRLSAYRGQAVLVVNVASRCGHTRQYAGLQDLYEAYRDRGLVVLGFPANDFGQQEPGTNEEILAFCTERFGVTFPMFAKISVTGPDQHPLYEYLTQNSPPSLEGPITWNFNKFLIGPDGRVVARFASGVQPDSLELTAAVERSLPQGG